MRAQRSLNSSKPDGTETNDDSAEETINNHEGSIVYTSYGNEIVSPDLNPYRDIIVAKPKIKRFPFPKLKP